MTAASARSDVRSLKAIVEEATGVCYRREETVKASCRFLLEIAQVFIPLTVAHFTNPNECQAEVAIIV